MLKMHFNKRAFRQAQESFIWKGDKATNMRNNCKALSKRYSGGVYVCVSAYCVSMHTCICVYTHTGRPTCVRKRRTERYLTQFDRRKDTHRNTSHRALVTIFPEFLIRSRGLICGWMCRFLSALSREPVHDLIHTPTPGLACGLTCGQLMQSVTAPEGE